MMQWFTCNSFTLFIVHFISCFGCFNLFSHMAYAETEVYVRHRASTHLLDPRQSYPREILQAALDKSAKGYRLTANDKTMSQSRALDELRIGQSIDVIWAMTTDKRETSLLPVRIPIYKGLIGWRLLLVKQSDELWDQQPRSLKQLQALHCGQLYDWPDYKILEHNNFKVYSSSSYQGLFKMLASKRIDFFPRSLVEIWKEAEIHNSKQLIVETKLALHYPAATYFFVQKSNTALANDIENGLELMIKSGEFNQIFQRYYQDILTSAQLDKRRIFNLVNPLLPEATPVHRAELWFSPKSIIANHKTPETDVQ